MKRFLPLLALLIVSACLPASAWPLVTGRDRQYTLKRGDDPQSVATRFGLVAAQIEEANPRLRGWMPGVTLRLPGRRILPDDPPRDGLVVNLAERGVYLFVGGAFRGFYPVAIGTPDRPTPTGTFKITQLVKNPTWLPPDWADVDEEVVPPGPDNPLGDRWIGLSAPGIGLHATRDVDSVGRAASHGCMRMVDSMVHALFTRVKKGLPVRIVYEPVKVGWDPAGQSLVLSVYADPYGRHRLDAYAMKVMRREGLAGLVDIARVKRIAKAHTGRPVGLGIPTRTVSVNGRRPDGPALVLGGRLWVAAGLARAMGAQVTYDAEERRIRISDGARNLDLPVSGDDADHARLIDGRPYVPARLLSDHLGANLVLASGTVRLTTATATAP